MTKETKTELCKNVKVEGKEEEDEWEIILKARVIWLTIFKNICNNIKWGKTIKNCSRIVLI